MQVVYEDNHIIIVSKRSGEIVQGDKTGDEPLSETVKQYIKEKYHKPGNVFLGVVHRLDRPVSGLVVFAKTSKALSRLNNMFRDGEVHKTYWAIVKNMPKDTFSHNKKHKILVSLFLSFAKIQKKIELCK
jgi:23S rRNA pseudouridine1911/1915/1917 synthase